jgi:hypothetical protein
MLGVVTVDDDAQLASNNNKPGTTAKPIARAVETALADNGDGEAKLMAASEWREQVAKMLEYNDPAHLEATMKLYGLWPTPKTKATRQEGYKILRRHRELRDSEHTEAETFEMVIKEYSLEV